MTAAAAAVFASAAPAEAQEEPFAQPAQAAAAFRQAAPLWNDLSERHPERNDYRRYRADSGLALSLVLIGEGKKREAEDELREAIRQYQQLDSASPSSQGHEKSRDAATRALKKLLSEKFGQTYNASMKKAQQLVAAGEYEAAVDHYRQSLEDHRRQALVVLGSPRSVAEQLEHWQRVLGYGILIAFMQFGSLPADLTRRNMELFAREVMPRLRPAGEKVAVA